MADERQDIGGDPLFEYASYRAIDGILIQLGASGGAKELRQLGAFYKEVAEEEGIGTRVEWTLKQIEGRVH